MAEPTSKQGEPNLTQHLADIIEPSDMLLVGHPQMKSLITMKKSPGQDL